MEDVSNVSPLCILMGQMLKGLMVNGFERQEAIELITRWFITFTSTKKGDVTLEQLLVKANMKKKD